MAYLTFNGTTVSVAHGSFKTNEEEIGNVSRSYSGALRASIIALKRTHSFTTTPLSVSSAETVRTLVHQVVANMSGDVISGATRSVRGFVTDATDTKVAAGVRRVLSITLTEV